jgi:hypothetical protein
VPAKAAAKWSLFRADGASGSGGSIAAKSIFRRSNSDTGVHDNNGDSEWPRWHGGEHRLWRRATGPLEGCRGGSGLSVALTGAPGN